MSMKIMQNYQYLMQVPNGGDQSFKNFTFNSLHYENCICKRLEASDIYNKRLENSHAYHKRPEDRSEASDIYAKRPDDYHKRLEASETSTAHNVYTTSNKEVQNGNSMIKKHFVNDPSPKMNLCDVCKKCFSTKGNLQNHHIVHSGQKPHKCSVCEKTFSQRSTLGKHYLIHTGEKPHVCSVCQRGFRQANNLRIHFLTHSGEKPHACSICKRGFTQKIALQKHMLTHTGVKPHACSVCDRRFTTKGNLQKHFLTHTGEKPHICGICNRGFSQKIALKKHHLTHTGEKPHVCSVCSKGFTTKGNLKSHFKRHAREKAGVSIPHSIIVPASIAQSLLVPTSIAQSILGPVSHHAPREINPKISMASSQQNIQSSTVHNHVTHQSMSHPHRAMTPMSHGPSISPNQPMGISSGVEQRHAKSSSSINVPGSMSIPVSEPHGPIVQSHVPASVSQAASLAQSMGSPMSHSQEMSSRNPIEHHGSQSCIVTGTGAHGVMGSDEGCKGQHITVL